MPNGSCAARSIPTAHYALCEAAHGRWDDAEDLVRDAIEKFPQRIVVKADGLAAGKGVILCDSHREAVEAAKQLFSGKLLGTPVGSLVIEEMLDGPEISYFAVCDGERAVTLGFAQDHKRIGEGDTGPNTGGMGAFSLPDLVTPETAQWLLQNVAQRVVDGMRAEGAPFRGILFTGLMMTADGPKVLEFNTRFGDPETQALMLRLQTGLIEILEASVNQTLSSLDIRLKPVASACVVAASEGYPGKFTAGKPLTLPTPAAEDIAIFHGGTTLLENGTLVTSGGRVLTVAATGADLATALERVDAALQGVDFEGKYYRRDIGWRALQQAE